MANFGVCTNPSCKRYYRLSLNGLRGLMPAMREREQQKKNKANLEPLFADYLPFFQFRDECSEPKCGKALHPLGRPTDDAELNEVLNAGNELRAWNVL